MNQDISNNIHFIYKIINLFFINLLIDNFLNNFIENYFLQDFDNYTYKCLS